MPNKLIDQNSPYLLQHAHNPVDWYPYGQEALQKAKTENKPIFLSIGYAACHWCHVMEKESFVDESTAEIMNRAFINIKVDREERPDVDAIYMRATVALTGSGGWPMSVFLTPDLVPFYAGTYFPPVARYGMPSFKDLLQHMEQAWNNDQQEILRVANANKLHFTQQTEYISSAEHILEHTIEEAVSALLTSYDQQHGGWGAAPKFPQPMALDLLLRVAANHPAKAALILPKVEHALNAMARGGMADLINGGFSRYSVDADWLVPHFEKMLYDNAQLALVYLHAYKLTNNPFYEQVCQNTLNMLMAEFLDPQGGFYSSLDADSEGHEGKYYTYSYDQIAEALGHDLKFFSDACVITPQGNWEGKIIIRRSLNDATLSRMFDLTPTQVSEKLKACYSKLAQVRAGRVRPATDDKILAMWNALAIRAFAEAGRYLDRPEYTRVAQNTAEFILDNMLVDGELKRSYRAGKAAHTAYLEDHAALAWALIALYQSDPDPAYYQAALERLQYVINNFSDPAGGFFDTHKNATGLFFRPKEEQDNATPSGNALAACALLEAAAYGDHPEWISLAEKIIDGKRDALAKYPTAFAQHLIATEFAASSPIEIALIFPSEIPEGSKKQWLSKLWSPWLPNVVAAIQHGSATHNAPKLLADRASLNGQTTLYKCKSLVCEMPITDLEKFDL